jgi:NAD(P)-dependent dehydrogenase (short-subunit alcohol dehydrogenase family)
LSEAVCVLIKAGGTKLPSKRGHKGRLRMTVMLNGRVVLLTGATSGIGRGIATLFVERGANVVGMARRAELGEALAKQLDGTSGSFFFVRGDITQEDDCQRVVEAAYQRHGRIDVLINNAANTGVLRGRVEEATDEEWARSIDTDLTGTFRMCRSVLPLMHRQGDGTIVNISSFAGVQGLIRHGAYGAAKAGVIQLTRVLAVENVAYGVRANAVIMGSVNTEGSNARRSSNSRGPLNAMRMEPADAARAIAILCTEDARSITGSTLAVDRGYTAGWHFSTLIQLGANGLLPDPETLDSGILG